MNHSIGSEVSRNMITISEKTIGEIRTYTSLISEYKTVIKDYETKIEELCKQIKDTLPKGYWYTCDIDKSWKRPKKYSIKTIDGSFITVKEVFKKKPWSGFTGEHTYSIEKFLNLRIHKTEQEAWAEYKARNPIVEKIREFMLLNDSPKRHCEYYKVYGYNVPDVRQFKIGCWVARIASIEDLDWLQGYKDRIHPDDDWTPVDLETYCYWIGEFDYKEANNLIAAALEANAVGYLD